MVGWRFEILEWGVRVKEACCYGNDANDSLGAADGMRLMSFDFR